MDDKRTYGLINDNGIIKGTLNGKVDRVDRMFLDLFINILKGMELHTDDAKVEEIRASLVVRENKKEGTNGDLVYKNYYVNNKKILCVRNNKILIGEINMDENVAKVMIEELSKLVQKKELKQETKKVTSPKSDDRKSKSKGKEYKEKNRVKKEREPIVSPYAEETKKILSSISEETMIKKHFAFMTEEDYKKRNRF